METLRPQLSLVCSDDLQSAGETLSAARGDELQGIFVVDDAQIYPKLTEIFRNVFADDNLVATPTLTAKDVHGWDSLRNIRLMLTIERAYGIRFSASEIGKLQNVGDLAQLVQAKL